MNAAVSKRECRERPHTKTVRVSDAPKPSAVSVIPLMSKEEGERAISQMPQRTLKEALEMKERMLGRA